METYTSYAEYNRYPIETYYVRRKLEGKLAYRSRKGKSVPVEAALYLSVLRICPPHPVCTVQIIPSINDRKERYIPFLQYLASRNIACVIHDLRGYGGSLLPEGVGFCGEEAIDKLQDDLDIVYASLFCPVPEAMTMELTPEDLPDIDPVPRYLLGCGMGALIAGLHASQCDEQLAGLLLAGLPHREPLVSCALTWVRFLSLFSSESWRPPFLRRFSFRKYNTRFARRGEAGDFLWLSENRENIEAVCEDPLCSAPETISACRFLLTLVRDLYRPASWNMARTDLPIRILSGVEDPVAGGDRWVLDSEDFFADMGYTNIENRLFPHCRHEIFMDNNRHAVWKETADCILAINPAETERITAALEEDQASYTSIFEKS